MAWDSSRPIPWRRFGREALLFLAIGVLLVALVFDPKDPAATYTGLALGAVLFVLVSAVLAKFGYLRSTLRDLREGTRAAAAAKAAAKGSQQPVVASRNRPAPTKRTTTGPSQRPNRTNKQRRR